MKERKSSQNISSGTLIAKNVIFNLLGYGLPLLLALIIIPVLIKNLGDEKFGILTLAWVIIGYFSFFDFGIGRALTKIVAEKIGIDCTEEIPSIFWTSFFMMLAVSVFITIILLFFAPYLVQNLFKISESLQDEALNAFYILIISIPIVTTTAGIRGVLEAYQKFAVINVLRTILGISSFLVPLICLIFTNNLFWIVLFLAIIRVIIWISYFKQSFRLNENLSSKIEFKFEMIKPILKFSGWITVSNFIVPFFVYSDRFLIGALVSAEAITFYATPYEVVSKLLLIPGAIAGVLFPAISASFLSDPDFTKKISTQAVKYIFIILFPILFIIFAFASEGLALWLGARFAVQSTVILRLLAVGVLFNSLAYIPYAFIEGIGRPDITAKIQLVELPLFLVAIYFMTISTGIYGVALVWMIRMIIDSLILFFVAGKLKLSNLNFNINKSVIIIFLISFLTVSTIFINSLLLKSILVFSTLAIFVFITWTYFLKSVEKEFLFSKLNLLFKSKQT